MSAIAWAASEISSMSHWIRTTAWTVISSGPFEDDGEPLPAGDAERREAERGAAFPHLVCQRQQDPRAAHPDRMAEGDPASEEVQPVPVELQLAFARDHLCRERLVDLDQIDVGEGE